MDKRLLISLSLSFLVLFAWSALNPSPQQTIQSASIAEQQQISSNTDALISDPSIESAVILDEIQSEISTLPENFQTLESNYLEVQVSDRGASINDIRIKKFDESFPIDQIFTLDGFSTKKFKLVSTDSQKITYTFTDNSYKIDKVINIAEDDFTLNVEYTITNLTEMSKNINLRLIPFVLDMSKIDINDKSISRDRALFEYVVSTDKKIHRKNNAYKFSDKDEKEFDEVLKWVGFRNRYYALIMNPMFEVENIKTEAQSDQKLKLNIKTQTFVIPPKGQKTLSALLYAGPEDLTKLKTYALGFENIKRFYKFTLLDSIAKIIYEILHWIHRIVPNWGLAIILISIIVYGSMYPLTLRSMMSMKQMQAVQPKIVALKTKYKDNPQKMNKELMEIYKENKINPLGGCIPILFQMPVFIGLYQVLWRDVSFKGANFLWIQDLSRPDRLFELPVSLPIVGNEFNLLPILMMGIMFVQTRLQAKNMTITDPAQQSQQKMMGMIMPFFLGFIFYKFASGLTLYFTMFYTFSTISQWYISRQKT